MNNTPLEQRARELLAGEYEAAGMSRWASCLRIGVAEELEEHLQIALRAISRALGDRTERDVLEELSNAIRDLGDRDPQSKLTYFEESPTKNGECHWRWVQLNNAQKKAWAIIASGAHLKDRG